MTYSTYAHANDFDTLSDTYIKRYSGTCLCGHLNKAVTSALQPVGGGPDLCYISFCAII